ncbi:Smr/MutS family protein [Streptomyces zaomyceticus]|uniref:Smr/MutS family protein n=1 Tax=Streptomyces zaomyceticus TaxID=68286 RepID=UPI0036BB62F7
MVQLIPGKGSGKLKQRVLAFLGQRHIRRLYHSVETLAGNEGRVIVRIRLASASGIAHVDDEEEYDWGM